MLVGGYSQDVSHVPILIPDLPKPAVTASQVVDRETLITFVEDAARVYREAVLSEGYATLTGIRNAFRLEGGDWKSGSIYLWVVSGGGFILFHATEPFREGQAHGPDEDGHQRGEVRRGADRRRAGARVGSSWSTTTTTPPSRETRTPVPRSWVTRSASRCPTRSRRPSSAPASIWEIRSRWDFAHFGNGSAISSDVVLVNLAATPIRPLVYFYDKTGDLIRSGIGGGRRRKSGRHGLRGNHAPVRIWSPWEKSRFRPMAGERR